MSGITKVLVVILGIQLMLALYLNLGGSGALQVTPGEKLLSLDFSVTTKITVTDKDKNSLTVAKKDGKWVLPEMHDFPVQERRVSVLSGDLMATTKAYPVGTTKVAAKQFKVQDDNFERKIAFFAGDNAQATVLLGTSPGFKKVHAKLSNDANVYAIKFNTFDVPSKAAEWFDKDILKINRSDIAKVRLNGFSIINSDNTFNVEGVEDGKETNPDEVNSLLSKITSLMLVDVLGTEAKPEYKLDAPVIKYSVDMKSNETLDYVVAGPIEENFYVVKVSKYPWYLKFSKSTLDPLKDITREKLIREKKSEPEPGTEGAVSTSAQQDAAAEGQEPVLIESKAE